MEQKIIQINSGTTINFHVSRCKKHHICEEDYVWNPSTCSCGKYFASFMDDSTIICDCVIKSYDEEIKSAPFFVNNQKFKQSPQIF